MPLYTMQCVCGGTCDAYVPTAQHVVARDCPRCGEPMEKGLSWGHGLTYFSEKNPQRIMNIDRGRTPIRSHKQHEDLMRRHQLTPATDWHTSKKPSRM